MNSNSEIKNKILMPYCIKKIGLLQNCSENINGNEYQFTYKKNNYLKLFDFCEETLISDVNKNSDFSLRKIEVDSNEYLAIYITINNNFKLNYLGRVRLIILCFENVTESELNANSTPITINTDSYDVTQRIYDLLRKFHGNEKFADEIENMEIQHHQLIPTLRQYQKRAVKWLLNRELNTETISLCYKEIYSSELVNNKIFYLDLNTLNIYDEKPIDIIIPTGGVLADEMGLGKTIEIIALILLNPAKQQAASDNINSKFSIPLELQNIESDSSDSEYLMEKRIRLRKKNFFFCICNKLKYSENSIVKCKNCGVLQHSKCVNFNKVSYNSRHICPNCWKKCDNIVSHGTIVVTPTSIKNQWYQEIVKHSKNLKVLQYNGIFNGWINPIDLSKYDIVLLDYNTLKKEINYLIENETNCSLRRKPKFMRVTSPLMMINWWRVCLDEAQLVESGCTKPSQMVQKLKTKHRWSVTGTPIQKSINDLRGLILFLDIYPFCEKKNWDCIVTKFLNNDSTPGLIQIFQKIMWRTSKENVQNELSIPNQLTEIHFLDLTDTEQLFYETIHSECKENFFEVVEKLISSSAVISQINPNILRKVLKPLKKLREDCTVPSILRSFKRKLQMDYNCHEPETLMIHLKKKNELECKNQLRSITSNLNGLAAIYIIKNEFEKAIEMYKTVLRYSADYSKNISVDSLIQIHALYNLRWIYHTQNINITEAKDMDSSLLKLEWKYLNSYYGDLKTEVLNFKSVQKKIQPYFEKNIDKDSELFCVQILEELKDQNLIQHLIGKFSDEIPKKKLSKLSFHNFHGIQYYMSNWLKNLYSSRTNIMQTFTSLFSFIESITPNTKSTPKLNEFIKQIFDCHLNEIRFIEENEEDPKLQCILCIAKDAIDKYECILFDKEFDEITNNVEGSWNPSLQEILLKLTINFSKNKLTTDIIENCEELINLLCCLKDEYKTITKLWIEIDYMVKAYDELNMSIIRLQIDDNLDNMKSPNKVIYKIMSYEVDSQFEDLNNKLIITKNLFARQLGRLRYLHHLEDEFKPGSCPICHMEPSDKYIVLECGHHMCMICLNILMKHSFINLTCAVCRNSQKFANIYYVNMRQPLAEDDTVKLKGNRSTKVEQILKLILKLRSQNKDVKILIFSYWESILHYLASALSENDILHRFRWNTKTIDEFKDPLLGITCLLLTVSHGSNGLNLIEATHVIIVEPILNPGEDLQAINRVHRIGQTQVTTIHRFIVKKTIEEKIYYATTGQNSWQFNKITIDRIKELFQ